MALLESIQIPLGTQMPDFELKDPDGKLFRGRDLYGKKGLLLLITCNHCPYAKAVWPRSIELSKRAEELGIRTAAINPNIHPDYPEDSADNMARKIRDWGIPFPYLVDTDQDTARALKAQCTPDIYLFDRDRKLVYHGRIDDNWEHPEQVKRRELLEAVEALGASRAISAAQKPSMGCSIKWR